MRCASVGWLSAPMIALAQVGRVGAAEAQAKTPALPALAVSRAEDVPDCPNAEVLAESVGRLRGRPALDPLRSSGDAAASELRFDVAIAKRGQDYVAHVRVSGPRS